MSTPEELEGLVFRLEACATLLEALPTLPKPYELFYAVKREGAGTGWYYVTCGVGVTEIRGAVDALKELSLGRNSV